MTMDTSESSALPPWMVKDTKGNKALKKRLKEKAMKQMGAKLVSRPAVPRSLKQRPIREPESEKYPFKLRLQFNQKCPDRVEIKKLHSRISNVVIPKRPPSCRWCTLKFTSSEDCEEVRSALNNKQIGKFKGKLRCYKSTSEVLNDIPDENLKEKLETQLKSAEVVHAKVVHMKVKNPVKPTIDFVINSTKRELNVRYGMLFQHSNKLSF